MKKIFYLSVFLLAFISCNRNYETKTTSTTLEHVDIIKVEFGEGGLYNNIKIFEVEHNGHDYLIFYGYETMGVEHSPDCKKCKAQSNYTPSEYLY